MEERHTGKAREVAYHKENRPKRCRRLFLGLSMFFSFFRITLLLLTPFLGTGLTQTNDNNNGDRHIGIEHHLRQHTKDDAPASAHAPWRAAKMEGPRRSPSLHFARGSFFKYSPSPSVFCTREGVFFMYIIIVVVLYPRAACEGAIFLLYVYNPPSARCERVFLFVYVIISCPLPHAPHVEREWCY